MHNVSELWASLQVPADKNKPSLLKHFFSSSFKKHTFALGYSLINCGMVAKQPDSVLERDWYTQQLLCEGNSFSPRLFYIDEKKKKKRLKRTSILISAKYAWIFSNFSRNTSLKQQTDR